MKSIEHILVDGMWPLTDDGKYKFIEGFDTEFWYWWGCYLERREREESSAFAKKMNHPKG